MWLSLLLYYRSNVAIVIHCWYCYYLMLFTYTHTYTHVYMYTYTPWQTATTKSQLSAFSEENSVKSAKPGSAAHFPPFIAHTHTYVHARIHIYWRAYVHTTPWQIATMTRSQLLSVLFDRLNIETLNYLYSMILMPTWRHQNWLLL